MTTENAPPWRQYLCRACGLIYDEALGDPDSGLAPGTRFEDIPDDWVCPLCGVMKADFEPCDAPGAQPQDDVPALAGAARRAAGVVVVGAGIAGWSAVQALRALDADVPITLVTACDGHRYHKPELSVAFGRGLAPQQLIREAGADAARRLGVALLADTFAVGLSPRLRQLRTTRGTLGYTKLVLAQGARAALPPPLSAALCWRVNDLAGWSGLHARLAGKTARVAIVGAGMIGCELAEDLAHAGHRVTLVDANAHPLSGLIPPALGARLADALRDAGIRYLGATRVESVERSERGDGTRAVRVATDAHGELEADEIVAAVGLVTPQRLARAAGLAFERGIVVDPRTMQTSAQHVYALGDCVSIGGAPCRFVEPIARQAAALAHHALQRAHDGYRHAAPVIRLKSRALPIVVHGAPVAQGVWDEPQRHGDGLTVRQWHDNRVVARLEARVVAPSPPGAARAAASPRPAHLEGA